MNLEFHHYQLPLRSAANSQSAAGSVEGLLIRADGGDGGYGCLQTWPSLGERSWQEEWTAIKRGDWSSPVAERLRACLRADAQGFQNGASSFEGCTLPTSYFTVSGADGIEALEAANSAGFAGGKIKGSSDWQSTLTKLRSFHQALPEWDWRVDFNGALDVGELRAICAGLDESLRQKISYLEDPCDDNQAWPEIDGVRLAEDRISSSGASSAVRVLKPAIHDWRQSSPARDLVLTTNFQHPLGMLFDWWEAGQAELAGRDLLPCGLVTQGIFAGNEWSEALGPVVPNPQPPSGLGLGLRDLLENLKWERA